jgi:tagatose kinase
MASVWTMGEILVEIMRPRADLELYEPAEFLGPYPSGAPAIFIDTVARLGHPAGMIGGVGDDDFGRCVLERLQTDGVDCRYVRKFANRSTAVAFVTYFQDGSRKFIFHIDQTPAVLIRFSGKEQVDSPAVFHIMGCSLMANDAFRQAILAAMHSFHTWGAKISFDPNIRTELLGDRSIEAIAGPVLENCTFLMPGVAELELLTGVENTEAGVQALFETTAIELIALKRGKRGSSLYTRRARVDIPAYSVVEVDPTGAGDCFDAALLCALLEGRPLEECGRMAAAAGALNAAAFGPMEGKISPESIARVIQAGSVVS